MRLKPLAIFVLAPVLVAAGACTPAPRAASVPTAQAAAGAADAADAPEATGGAEPAPALPPAPSPDPAPATAREPAGLAPSQPAAEPISVDFATQVRPILESRCQPCHFPGGKMYDRLPFDRAETVHLLGEKLFTRIKAADDQALIRAFLAEGAGG
jgi:hypothetical protein